MTPSPPASAADSQGAAADRPRAILALSPHLDDAVLACGQWLAAHPGARVVTVFAGTPPDARRLTEWDAACGFASAGEAVAARRAEDRAALAHLHAEPVWLEFLDSQYGDTPAPTGVAAAIEPVLAACRPDTVLMPLGLFHTDHELVHDAALQLMRRQPALRWLGYEDALYRRIPGLLQARLAALLQAGIRATPAAMHARAAQTAHAKRAAVACYASQLRALAAPGRLGHADAFEAERFWRLEPANAAAAQAIGSRGAQA